MAQIKLHTLPWCFRFQSHQILTVCRLACSLHNLTSLLVWQILREGLLSLQASALQLTYRVQSSEYRVQSTVFSSVPRNARQGWNSDELSSCCCAVLSAWWEEGREYRLVQSQLNSHQTTLNNSLSFSLFRTGFTIVLCAFLYKDTACGDGGGLWSH